MSGHRVGSADDTPVESPRDALRRIETALQGLRYGTVTAVVQDGVVVQVDRTEKIRIERVGPASRREPGRGDANFIAARPTPGGITR